MHNENQCDMIKQAMICVICLEQFEIFDNVVIFDECFNGKNIMNAQIQPEKHKVHYDCCLNMIRAESHNCPLCKTDIKQTLNKVNIDKEIQTQTEIQSEIRTEKNKRKTPNAEEYKTDIDLLKEQILILSKRYEFRDFDHISFTRYFQKIDKYLERVKSRMRLGLELLHKGFPQLNIIGMSLFEPDIIMINYLSKYLQFLQYVYEEMTVYYNSNISWFKKLDDMSVDYLYIDHIVIEQLNTDLLEYVLAKPGKLTPEQIVKCMTMNYITKLKLDKFAIARKRKYIYQKTKNMHYYDPDDSYEEHKNKENNIKSFTNNIIFSEPTLEDLTEFDLDNDENNNNDIHYTSIIFGVPLTTNNGIIQGIQIDDSDTNYDVSSVYAEIANSSGHYEDLNTGHVYHHDGQNMILEFVSDYPKVIEYVQFK